MDREDETLDEGTEDKEAGGTPAPQLAGRLHHNRRHFGTTIGYAGGQQPVLEHLTTPVRWRP
jgi:hypothetical protein